MKLSLVLTVSAVYMAIFGVVMLISPAAATFGAVDSMAATGVIHALRIPASMAIGIAILNWLARNAGPSKAMDAIVTGNMIGFAIAGLLVFWATYDGGSSIGWALGIFDLALAGAFFMTRKAST